MLPRSTPPRFHDEDIVLSHFIDPEKKNSRWAAYMMDDYYRFGGAVSMLHGKKIQEINQYYSGDQSVNKYKKMFRRMAKEMELKVQNEGNGMLGDIGIKDITGIEWESLGILANPMSSVHNTIQKIPLYVKATAIDSLAEEKKQKDYEFIKNRPALDKDLGKFSEALKIRIDSPAAENNAESVDISNFDLNPQKEDELNFYMSMFYKLRPESAFEATLLALAYTQKLKEVRDLEGKDQLKFARSANRAYFSDITGLPMIDYLDPAMVYTPESEYNDYHDVSHKYIKINMTMEQFMDACGNDMNEVEAQHIFDYWFKSQKLSMRWTHMDKVQRRAATIPVIYMEFKSWDVRKFHTKLGRSGNTHHELVDYDYTLRFSRNHPDKALRGKPKDPTPEEFIEKKYIQNTYCGYWLHFYPEMLFKYKKLEHGEREAGKEALSTFSINTYRTKDKSDTELAMPLVDDAQRAYFKMQHCIIMSKPRGSFVDMKYVRNAVANMIASGDDYKLSVRDIMTLYSENNILIGDSEGIDPEEQQSGARPFYDIPGGVGDEINGYLMIINDAMQKIGKLTGTDGLTNQTPNPEGLVGLQKLMLQNSQNSIYYVINAMRFQTEQVFKTWASQVQYILKHRGTASYRAIEAIIGSYKVKVLEDLHTIPSHQFGIMVENVPTEQEQAELNAVLQEMLVSDRINLSDWVTIRRVFNWKDAQQLLAIRERKRREEKREEMQIMNQAMLQGVQMEQEGKLQNTNIGAQATIQKEKIKSDTTKWQKSFEANVQQQLAKLNGQIKDILQERRAQHQKDKAREVASMNTQKAIE